MLAATLDHVAGCGNIDILIGSLGLSACIAAELGDGLRAARLAGAAEAIQHKTGTPVDQSGAAFLERYLAPARAAIERGAWDAELAAGRALTRDQAVALLSGTPEMRSFSPNVPADSALCRSSHPGAEPRPGNRRPVFVLADPPSGLPLMTN